MITFLKVAWRVVCILLAITYLASCFTAFIPASVFSFTVFFALLFPYLFLLVIAIAIANIFLNKKWAIAFFLLLIPGLYNFFHTVAISPFSSWTMKKDTSTVRVMTWNVSDFVNPAPLNLPDAKERREILHTISEFSPDILCIQEYYNADSSRDLPSEKHELDSLGYHYSAFSGDAIKRTFYGVIEMGTAIYSKTPFFDTGRLRIRRDFNTEYMLYADMLIHNKPVRISSAHLTSFYIFPDSARGYIGRKTVAKKLYTYKRNVETRLRETELMHDKEVTLIRSVLDTSSYPVIYCGDMNATPAMYSYRMLKADRQDAFLQKGNGIGATFYNIVPTLRIDVCFPDTAFTVKQCTVANRQLGDHNPVITDLSWKER